MRSKHQSYLLRSKHSPFGSSIGVIAIQPAWQPTRCPIHRSFIAMSGTFVSREACGCGCSISIGEQAHQFWKKQQNTYSNEDYSSLPCRRPLTRRTRKCYAPCVVEIFTYTSSQDRADGQYRHHKITTFHQYLIGFGRVAHISDLATHWVPHSSQPHRDEWDIRATRTLRC
jgi:hypothetical protein